MIKKTAVFIFCLLINFSFATAQADMGKADKEYELGAYQKAANSYLKELKKDPDNGKVMAKLASAYFRINKIDEAVLWFEQSLKSHNPTATTVFTYARALQMQGAYSKAKKWFESYAEGFPDTGRQYASNCEFAIESKKRKSLYRITPEYLNTDAAEFGPAFFKNKVVFSSTRGSSGAKGQPNQTDWAGNANNKLFISGLDNNSFLTSPALLRGKIKNATNEGPLSYSEDGKLVCYTKNNFVESTRQIPEAGFELSLYLASAKPSGDWDNDKPFPYNGSGYSTGFPCFAENGNTLLFASDRPDGYGGFDLYISHRIGNTWSVPENLGPNVNTPGNEIYPSLDNNILYFSSDWLQGLGGFDIFRAEKDESKKWSRIFHLGNEVNSSYDDYGFIFDADRNIGYFCSNRPGRGLEDLYKATKITDNITITVLDDKNQAVVGAMVDLKSCDEEVFKTDASGLVSFQALKGFNCEAIIRKSGFETVAFNIRSEGTTQAKNMEVVLRRTGMDAAYMGRVLDAVDGQPREGVYVQAVSQQDGAKVQSLSNSNGEYFLELKSGENYVVKYSMAGYTESNKVVRTGNGADRNILGELRFVPSGTAIADAGTSTTTTTTTPPDTGASMPSHSPAPPIETKPSAPASSKMKNGFSVQIAAIAEDKSIDYKRFENVTGLNNFYTKNEKGKTKFRVGVYEDYSRAESMRKGLVAKGYESAFVVKEKLTPSESDIVVAENNADVSINKGETKTETLPSPPVTGNGNFMIRLASYKNPNYFKAEKVEHLGRIEKRMSGEFTVMLLAGYASIQDAEDVVKVVKESGFKGAHIVEEKAGKLIKPK